MRRELDCITDYVLEDDSNMIFIGFNVDIFRANVYQILLFLFKNSLVE